MRKLITARLHAPQGIATYSLSLAACCLPLPGSLVPAPYTPYVRAHMQVVLDEMDLQDLRNTALPGTMADVTAVSGPAGGGSRRHGTSSGVRIATVDNYQVTILTPRCGT